jgi:hypothetical protein
MKFNNIERDIAINTSIDIDRVFDDFFKHLKQLRFITEYNGMIKARKQFTAEKEEFIKEHPELARGNEIFTAISATETSSASRLNEWMAAERKVWEQDLVKAWKRYDKQEPGKFKIIRAGDVPESEKAWNDFKKNWDIAFLFEGKWFITKRDPKPKDVLELERAKKKASSSREKSVGGYALTTYQQSKARALHKDFWNEAGLEKALIKEEIIQQGWHGTEDELNGKAWDVAMAETAKRWTRKNGKWRKYFKYVEMPEGIPPTPKDSWYYYAELFANEDRLKTAAKEKKTKSKKKGKK